jgi:hypothetical protein
MDTQIQLRDARGETPAHAAASDVFTAR